MKKILKITLLLIIACFIAACGASKEEKLLDLAAKIEYNKPLIIESVRKHQVDSTMVDSGMIKRDEEIKISTLAESFYLLGRLALTVCFMKEPAYRAQACALVDFDLRANSSDNNVWVVDVVLQGPGVSGDAFESFKILKDKKRIMARDEKACLSLNSKLAKLLIEKNKTEPVNWEKQCSFPIKFVKGIK